LSDPITNILYAVGGAIGGGFITYIYRICWYKRTKFIDACNEFKAAFSDVIHWLNYDAIADSIRTPGKLKEFHERHKDAINKFGSFLSINKRRKFDIACESFYNKKDNHYYVGYSGLDTSPQKESREVVLENINKLFHFAKC